MPNHSGFTVGAAAAPQPEPEPEDDGAELDRQGSRFGALKDDPLDVQGIAHIMKYSAEDTDPTFYGDMNAKCYVPDRAKIDPCKMAILSSSRLYCVSLTWKSLLQTACTWSAS